MNDTIDSMDWWQKHMPSWIGGKRAERIENETNIQKLVYDNSFYKESLINVINQSNEYVSYIEQNTTTNLIYWKDKMGEHSYYTDDVIIK
ncbi:hypothetical protein FACS1894163_09840 [Spirochaetia bacterium]|nr:hypothetical protein FACS1894163_09840 [Spirochaetia bacterium]